jgi:hypothetical protein
MHLNCSLIYKVERWRKGRRIGDNAKEKATSILDKDAADRNAVAIVGNEEENVIILE